MEWKTELNIGERATAFSEMLDVQKKGFEKGSPMVFVKQKIEYKREGSDRVAILEERSHVYLAAPANRRGAKQGMCTRRMLRMQRGARVWQADLVES